MKNLTRLHESSLTEVGKDHEAIRKHLLHRVYTEKFKHLTSKEEMKQLALSGRVWKEFAELDERPSQPGSKSTLLINQIEKFSKTDPHKFDLFENSRSWRAFMIALTNSSLSIEGHTIPPGDTKILIDTFQDNISSEIGFTEDVYLQAKDYLGEIKEVDAKATVDHAAAMEHLKNNIKKSLDSKMVIEINNMINPPNKFDWCVSGLEDSEYRKTTIKVRTSSIVRPYPHEVSSLMNNLIQSYHESNHHPIVNIINLFYNFLFIHPFSDGNGRTARLLMNMELFKHGFVGCDVQLHDRREYMSHFDRCFYYFDYEPSYVFFLDRIRKLQLSNSNGNIE
jgi:hypothetical protein